MQRFHRNVPGLTMLSGLVLVCLATSAGADPLLIDFNSTSQDNGPHPQTGYQSYDAGHEVADDFIPVGYSAFGTTVTLTPTWPDTTDNLVMQMIDRTTSGPPTSSHDANYLGDMLDLVTDWIGADARPDNGGNGTTGPTTMELTLSGLPAGDYFYRAYHHDTEYMNPEFSLSLNDADGTTSIGTFEVTGSSAHANNVNPVSGAPGFGPEVLSSTVDFPFRSDGSDVVFQYEVMEGANVHESFVVVNGIEIWDEPIPPLDLLTLEVNTDTGATRILNLTGNEKDINYYEINSVTGSLNLAGWNSLDAQNFDTIGSGVGESWDEAGGSDEEILSEIYFHGSSNLADQVALSLGNAFDRSAGQKDVTFSYGLTSGGLIPGLVEYVTGGTVDDADFDGDGDVDGADFLTWQSNTGTSGGLADGDANGDGNVDGADLTIWQGQFGNASAAAAATAAVPEPASSLLAWVGLLAVVARRRFHR